MNSYKKILSFLFVLTLFSSCSKGWLDINVDPNTPSSTVASVQSRLAWIQHYYLYAQGTAGTRAGFVTQQLTFVNSTNSNSLVAGWNPAAGMSTTPYQFFFVGAGANFKDLEDKATAESAYHYLGALHAIKAMGFMLMADWYGEMPYTEALSTIITPKFDNGKVIFEGCLADIDKAIEYFSMAQPNTAAPLSAGDSWNGGDVNKWLKMCYGLKARWLNNLSKKSALYKPDEILAALNKAPLAIGESTVVSHMDDATDNIGDILFADPVKTSIVFNNAGMNMNTLLTKWYVDLLTNFDNKGIEDPRADKLIPWAEFGYPKELVRSKGVDMLSKIRMESGPITPSFNEKDEEIESNGRKVAPHSWYINTANTARWGDTVYVSIKSSSKGYDSDKSDIARWKDSPEEGGGTIAASGTFYSRPDAPTHLVAYPEMCFIKAEVLFNKGDKAGAFNAYKDGIRAHIDLMNAKLNTYGNVNVSKSPMGQTKIDNFLNKGIGTAGDITLAKIMMQKFIALSFSQQNWNDMRRYDFSNSVYPGWAVPYEYTVTAAAQTKIPIGKQFRRVRQVSHEINYNSDNLKASHPNALNDDIWSFPVWWDIKE
ncbi:SusD/RagB family nutrient-binding outer membrane lipoprotein [Sphingobacterium sp. DR205]|uniref:SusD/RagB family nutrient-binding outer membrane lipoprotein n=1 Tax=Sphingobacterium sp. DR205 TaxID=2713573 RepID=UPI0013E4CD1F|nr:SusD/RagB family nutrient-binding outer membrane lipoprotein [Sphingobacterium sp. DR205]QIH36579.1 SusD/RagB family nutrient-binding outer membrane lipoprotein [Sphingobacterium sp. DR205]